MLYTPVPITPVADTASSASHNAGLLLSPVLGIFVVGSVGLFDSVGSVGLFDSVGSVGLLGSVGSVVDFV